MPCESGYTYAASPSACVLGLRCTDRSDPRTSPAPTACSMNLRTHDADPRSILGVVDHPQALKHSADGFIESFQIANSDHEQFANKIQEDLERRFTQMGNDGDGTQMGNGDGEFYTTSDEEEVPRYAGFDHMTGDRQQTENVSTGTHGMATRNSAQGQRNDYGYMATGRGRGRGQRRGRGRGRGQGRGRGTRGGVLFRSLNRDACPFNIILQ